MKSKKKIIIFGGAGFIGNHFIDYLSSTYDYKILSYDIDPDARSFNLDIRQNINLSDQMGLEDIIINLAAVHRMPGHKDFEYFETNIKGAENVCEFAEKKGINNIIFTSSIAPYGAGEDIKTEETLPTPNTPYGISKLVAEHIHKCWQAKDPKRKLLIIRPGVVYGKGEKGNNTRLYNALKSGKFFYPGRKDTIKANIYVKDLVQLTFQIFNSFNSGIRLYNFTYEPAYTLQEIVDTICEVTKIQKPKLSVNSSILLNTARIMHIFGSGRLGIHPDRIKKLLISTNVSGKKILIDGFKYQYNLKDSIEDWHKDCNFEGLY